MVDMQTNQNQTKFLKNVTYVIVAACAITSEAPVIHVVLQKED